LIVIFGVELKIDYREPKDLLCHENVKKEEGCLSHDVMEMLVWLVFDFPYRHAEKSTFRRVGGVMDYFTRVIIHL
jgi:hypothetical protein